MNTRLMKYSLVAVLALLLALPAVAYSQRGGPGNVGEPRGPGFGAAGQEGLDDAPGQRGGRMPRGAVGAARAQRRPRPDRAAGMRGFGAGIGGHALAHADEIGLTEDQRDRILAARRDAREASINRRADIGIARLELGELMDAEARDLGAIEAKLRELADLRVAEQIGALRTDEAVRDVLSTEQIDALENLPRARSRGAGIGDEPRPRRPIR